MAEAALFTLASKVLSMVASPAFDKAYEKARSIWGAKEELEELKETIQTIQGKLLDAEKKHRNTTEVQNWIDRVRDVLYDAEDLFDEVSTHYMIKQQVKGGKHKKEDPAPVVREFQDRNTSPRKKSAMENDGDTELEAAVSTRSSKDFGALMFARSRRR